jgi:hypothetical protein
VAEPPVPATFRERLRPLVGGGSGSDAAAGDTGGAPSPLALEAAARAALARALSPGEAERRGAFELLAADALLTWAAEGALGTEDPEGLLVAMVGRLCEAREAG